MGAIIGTAGHIDHGKTSLVKALTGQDTDRLKEEKERGISIELGFAFLDLPDGTRVGVVDVPGHERFVRTMLAGAHGIDVALFTVAADDGVMPQTVEHLDIVHLLRIPRAIFVVTKVDLVTPSRVREAEREIRSLVARTPFEQAAIVPFSFLTGQGLAEVRARIITEIGQCPPRRRARHHFRLPIDRVFVLQGHGLVVTGTAVSGQVSVGDRLRCLPSQQVFRVRSLHVHNQPVEVATEGQRVALNLTGPDRPGLVRGDVLVAEGLTLTVDRFDAWLELRPASAPGLKSRQRVRVHLGTANRLARVRIFGARDRIGPNESSYCQIVLEQPVSALRGDRFVVRDETSQVTLGGGLVLHPQPSRHRGIDPGLASRFEALHLGTPARVLEVLLDEEADCALPESLLAQLLNVPEEDMATVAKESSMVLAFDIDHQRWYTTRAKVRHVEERLRQALLTFHADHPLAAGMDLETIRDAVSRKPDTDRGGAAIGIPMNGKVFRAVVDQLISTGAVVREANLLRLPQHVVRLDDNHRALVDRVRALLLAEMRTPPVLDEVAKRLGVSRASLGAVIRVMERDQFVVRVASEIYFVREAIDEALQIMRARWSDGGTIAPGVFREAIGTTRKYAIPLLEYFDRVGVTARAGGDRWLKGARTRGR